MSRMYWVILGKKPITRARRKIMKREESENEKDWEIGGIT
jgi:hypothetical protein